MSKPILETRDLNKAFFMGETIYAVNNVSIEVQPGEMTVILGPSGSGKSTLLSLLGGLDRPISGDVLVDGQSYAKLNEDQLAILRRKRIGYVFQFFNLIPHLTAQENVELPMAITGESRTAIQKRASSLLEQVGLGTRRQHRPNQLSGGEQQRVAIARALANCPAVVLADEPTGNLDSTTRDVVVDLFRHFNRVEHQTFVIITHDEAWTAHADRVIRLRDGRVVSVEARQHGAD